MNTQLLITLNDFLNKNNLTLLSEDFDFIVSIGWKTQLPIQCKKCKANFLITTKQLLQPHPPRNGVPCPRCRSEDLFKSKLTELYGENPYEFISQFQSYTDPIRVKCKDCGFEWEADPARNLLMKGTLEPGRHPCRACSAYRAYEKNTAILKDELIKKFGMCSYEFPKIEFKGKYSSKKLKVKCLLCGAEFEASMDSLLNPKNGKHYCKKCQK